jgi:MFS transporter, FHS family, L-fucose permease
MTMSSHHTVVSANAPPANDAPLFMRGAAIPFLLVTVLFFLWGIPNNVNDVLIRQFMKSFVITRFEAGLIQFAFYLGYFLLAIPAALFMRKLGYKAGFLVGLSLFTVGTFLFWPAALASSYWFFLVALFVIASGLAFLETAANPFIAQLGDPCTAARRLNLAQAFNPLGAVTGVFFGTIFIFSGIELQPQQVVELQARNAYSAYLQSETMRVVVPYLVLGGLALTMLILIAVTRFPSSLTQAEDTSEGSGSISALLRYPHFYLAVISQFLYVGSQVGTWSYFIPYVETYTHQPEKMAGYLLTGALVAFGAGRFSSAWLMRYVAPARLMGLYAVINTVLALTGVAFPGWLGLWALLLTSFFMSLMFPTIFALGVRGLGENTKIGGSMIVMAIAGGAVLTLIMGFISTRSGNLALAYLVPMFGYISVALYAFADGRLAPKHELKTTAL